MNQKKANFKVKSGYNDKVVQCPFVSLSKCIFSITTTSLKTKTILSELPYLTLFERNTFYILTLYLKR